MRWSSWAVLGMALFAAGPALAQTGEGTVITNTATATWTDANSNSYTPATASTSVTVGFVAGPSVSASGGSTPLSPSSANEGTVTGTNGGNGTDQLQFAFTIGSGLTATG